MLLPSASLLADPLLATSMCSGNDVPGATCVTITNTVDEAVSVESAGRETPFILNPYEIMSGTFITGSTITATGVTSKKIYMDKRLVQGKEQPLYIEVVPLIVEVKSGSFPFLVLTVVSGLILLALGLAVGLTNAKVNKQCPTIEPAASGSPSVAGAPAISPQDIDIDKLLSSLSTPAAEAAQVGVDVAGIASAPSQTSSSAPRAASASKATRASDATCSAERVSKSKLSWWLLLLPVLVFAGALVGYILIQANALNRATIVACKARKGSWQAGYVEGASSTRKNLCRMFGICDCLNANAQVACARLGVVNANAQLYKRVYIPPPACLTSYAHDTRMRNAVVYAQEQVESSKAPRFAGLRKGASAPTYAWDQSVANRPEGFGNACCPTAEAPPGSECYDCSSGTCLQGGS